MSWAPNYADVSSNGLLGYTTGNWEYRPGGADAEPAGYGEFITVWQKMPDGKYKFVADLGVSHPKPTLYSIETAAPAYKPTANEKRISAADSANQFFEYNTAQGLARAYAKYAASEARMFREDKQPIIGRDKIVSELKSQKSKVEFKKRSVFFESADVAYITNSYTMTKADKSIEKGNFLQIWKFIDGRWQIVIDVFAPLPAEAK